MSKLKTFSFENQSVRTLGSSDFPLFVAVDVIHALGFKDTINPIKRHIDPEDLIKSEITDKLGRKQTVNCVNESGLYALIFGSKLESAKRFKRWVTSEVLPAIRKNGRYELPRETISTEQQYLIRKAVERSCRKDPSAYSRTYHQLYDRFQVPSYKDLKTDDFLSAMAFLGAMDMVEETERDAFKATSGFYLTQDEAELLLTNVYYYRYLFRDVFNSIYSVLQLMESPLSGKMYEACTNISLVSLELKLGNHGYRVKDLPCYQHWAQKRLAKSAV